jgi:hypothetical protein
MKRAMDVTATVNVIDGKITVDVPGSEDTDFYLLDGRLFSLQADVEPWGEEESGLKRADDALADMGWVRIAHWCETRSQVYDVPVVPAQREAAR